MKGIYVKRLRLSILCLKEEKRSIISSSVLVYKADDGLCSWQIDFKLDNTSDKEDFKCHESITFSDIVSDYTANVSDFQ